jgi:hypothetical protein
MDGSVVNIEQFSYGKFLYVNMLLDYIAESLHRHFVAICSVQESYLNDNFAINDWGLRW